MSEFAQFDDELLSAYLDDELAPEERARVEQRLAADPQARQLLDELRSVSQAMKGLPPATLGADLRESVLRRAERAMLVAGERGSANASSEVAHRMPIGRSKRAWFWAATALAAGLMLMVFQRDPARNQGLPAEVAKNEPRANTPKEPLPPLAMRSLDTATDNDEQVRLESALEPESVLEDDALHDEVATVPRDAAPPAGGVAAAGRPEGSMSASGGAGGFGGGRFGGGVSGGAAELAKAAEAAGAAGEMLVVHVSLTPEAMQNRAFDTTLLNNRIVVEDASSGEAKAKESQDIEVVVVEAAPEQVYSTLAEINADRKQYLAIAVDEQSRISQRARARQSGEKDVRQYNRGLVTRQQEVQLAPDSRNYYFSTEQDRFGADRQLAEQRSGVAAQRESDLSASAADRSGPAQDAPVSDPHSSDSVSSDTQSLALSREGVQIRSSSSAQEPPPASGQAFDAIAGAKLRYFDEAQQNVARRAVQKLAAKADMLQVLFVLQSEAAPATAASPAAAPTSAVPAELGPAEQRPTEEGLKSDE